MSEQPPIFWATATHARPVSIIPVVPILRAEVSKLRKWLLKRATSSFHAAWSVEDFRSGVQAIMDVLKRFDEHLDIA